MTDDMMVGRMDSLESAMAPYIRTYQFSFEDLSEVDETFRNGEALPGNVQLILTDPPYNIRNNMGSTNADHDVLTSQPGQCCGCREFIITTR